MTTNGNILKQSHDQNHAPFIVDMPSSCGNWYSLPVCKIWRL